MDKDSIMFVLKAVYYSLFIIVLVSMITYGILQGVW